MKKLHITIIGLGLIGGSLALSFRQNNNDCFRVTGTDADKLTREQAVKLQVVDNVAEDVCDSVRDADVVFLCTPVLQIVPLVEKIAPYLKQGAILSDVGSTKEYLQEKLTKILPNHIHYIGGHPMAGKEKSGITAADKDLFRNKWYILMSGAKASSQAIALLEELISSTGAIITTMDTETHDRCTAVLSHVPHLAAAALVNLLEGCSDQGHGRQLAGGGFRDTTRVASSNADMWADICMTNQDAISDGLEKMQSMLQTLNENIRRGDRQAVHEFFHNAKMRRDELLACLPENSN